MRHALFIVTMLATGCDGGEPMLDAGMDPVTASCNRDALYLCEQYLISPARLADLETSCVDSGGEWAEAECPSAGNFGGCRETGGDGEMILFHYAEGDFANPDEVMAECTANGQEYVAP